MEYNVTIYGPYAQLGSFDYNDGELLWQAMCELDLGIDVDDDTRLAEWQDLPDDNIEALLNAAVDHGFISNWDWEETEDN